MDQTVDGVEVINQLQGPIITDHMGSHQGSHSTTGGKAEDDEILKILHFNSQSVRNKALEIDALLNEGLDNNAYDFVCISEHFLNIDEDKMTRGGVMILSHSRQLANTFKKCTEITALSKEQVCEVAAIEIVNINLIVVAIYRSPLTPKTMLVRNCEQAFPEKSKLVDPNNMKNMQNQWFTDDLKKYRDCLKLLTQINRSNPHLVSIDEIKNFRRLYSNKIQEAKRQANDEYIRESGNAQKAMWDIIKSNNVILSSSSSSPENLKAHDFNTHFVNYAKIITEKNLINSVNSTNNTDTVQFADTVFDFKEISFNQLRDIINKIKNTPSKDAFSLNIRIIKNVKNIILIPLTKLINEAIRLHSFPDCLKVARVVPIYKKGIKDDPSNYRPISIIPVIGKILETVLNDQLITYFEDNMLFSDHQFGFRKKKSTIMALIRMVECIQHGFNGGNPTLAYLTLKCSFEKYAEFGENQEKISEEYPDHKLSTRLANKFFDQLDCFENPKIFKKNLKAACEV
ncbi:unnamed protein product [Callosobruchus maculatus]|uniref:Uncharacterized protein n=1 Tax=Callosobruchus maculatus TaxID=64391 RepID=A0A653DSA5_CALMS|nr:unnamed protein product [Callosobruchus maculatus]